MHLWEAQPSHQEQRPETLGATPRSSSQRLRQVDQTISSASLSPPGKQQQRGTAKPPRRPPKGIRWTGAGRGTRLQTATALELTVTIFSVNLNFCLHNANDSLWLGKGEVKPQTNVQSVLV